MNANKNLGTRNWLSKHMPPWIMIIMPMVVAITLAAIFGLSLTFPTHRALAATEPPTVNGLFWGDGDYARYELYAESETSGSKIFTYVDESENPPKLYVAMVVGRSVNDNVFDQSDTAYMRSAGWITNTRNARKLVDSEQAQFYVTICQADYDWMQGYARQDKPGGPGASDNTNDVVPWTSNHEIDTGEPTPPPGYESSSSLVWNMNRYAELLQQDDQRFEMNAYGLSNIENWKSPYTLTQSDTVTITGGYPVTATEPITFSEQYQWEWPMVYEWSVELSDCAGQEVSYTIDNPYSHHSPSKTETEDDYIPTAVTLTALRASGPVAAMVLPAAGLLLGASALLTAPRRRRRR